VFSRLTLNILLTTKFFDKSLTTIVARFLIFVKIVVLSAVILFCSEPSKFDKSMLKNACILWHTLYQIYLADTPY
jgi:hypothetical protein